MTADQWTDSLNAIHSSAKEYVYTLELWLGFVKEYAFNENPHYRTLYNRHFQKRLSVGQQILYSSRRMR